MCTVISGWALVKCSNVGMHAAGVIDQQLAINPDIHGGGGQCALDSLGAHHNGRSWTCHTLAEVCALWLLSSLHVC